MKMIEGARLRASSKRSRTRDAPTPTNISTKLEPVRAKKRDVRLARHRPRHERLAAPGRPDHENAPRADGAGALVALGMLEEVDDFAHFAFCILVAGDVGEARGGPLLVVDLGLRAADTP